MKSIAFLNVKWKQHFTNCSYFLCPSIMNYKVTVITCFIFYFVESFFSSPHSVVPEKNNVCHNSKAMFSNVMQVLFNKLYTRIMP